MNPRSIAPVQCRRLICCQRAVTYIQDLHAYTYLDRDRIYLRTGEALAFTPKYERLAVGWLAEGQPFPVGDPPDGFMKALNMVQSRNVFNITRGLHPCDFCSGPYETLPKGNAETRVPTARGVVYAAPSLIGHYIERHGYLLPAEFIAAVLEDHDPDWMTPVVGRWIPDGAELWSAGFETHTILRA